MNTRVSILFIFLLREIEIADFRLKVLTKTIDEMNERKTKLESNFRTLATKCKVISKFYIDLAQYEQDLTKLESKFRDAFSNFNINNTEVIKKLALENF